MNTSALKNFAQSARTQLLAQVSVQLDRALNDHELIKVKLAVGSRESRSAATREICERLGAELIQGVGNIILVLRRSPKPDPRLSNLIRPL